MKANNYYAVEIGLFKGKPVYIELDHPVSDYNTAIDLAVDKAIRDGLIDGWEDVRCELEVYESMK